jgi:4-amino-4-deoxy-L-arabinose transferase-like glycosyltransferase
MLIGAATFVLRAVRLDVSWDIFVDEISYLRISQSVAQHLEVKLYGNAFYLHPPAFFFLEAAYIKLIAPAGDVIHQIYDVRYLNVALASITAVVLLEIGRRLAGWLAGIAVAAVFTLDPYIIKMNSRNYLDTSAMLWVVLGYCVLFSSMTDANRRLPLRRLLAAGFFFGLGLLTKDMIVFATLLPLAVCFVTGWAMPRLQSAIVGVVALLTYLPYPVVVYAIGDWRDFTYQKFHGLSRLAGFIHETGFNQEGGPSFLNAILANLQEFATTYAFLATGSISTLVLFFFFGGAAKRLLLAWTGSTYVLLAYIVVKGTLEEQFFYLLIVPSMLATVVTARLVIETASLDLRLRRALLTVTVLLAIIFLSWTGYVWFQVHFAPDNGYERVAAYVADIPDEYSVGVTNDTTQFVMKDLLVNDSIYDSVEELQADDIDYVVISSKLVEQGYGPSPSFYHWVKNQGKLAYGFVGRSFGLMGVYRLPEHTAGGPQSPQAGAEEYVGKVAAIQSKSVKALLDSDEKLGRYDALSANDVSKMAASRTSLKGITDRVDSLDPPREYEGQYKVFRSAIDEMYKASTVAYGLAADPVSATQADFNAYYSLVDEAEADLRSSNKRLGHNYETIETSRGSGP